MRLENATNAEVKTAKEAITIKIGNVRVGKSAKLVKQLEPF